MVSHLHAFAICLLTSDLCSLKQNETIFRK